MLNCWIIIILYQKKPLMRSRLSTWFNQRNYNSYLTSLNVWGCCVLAPLYINTHWLLLLVSGPLTDGDKEHCPLHTFLTNMITLQVGSQKWKIFQNKIRMWYFSHNCTLWLWMTSMFINSWVDSYQKQYANGAWVDNQIMISIRMICIYLVNKWMWICVWWVLYVHLV